VGVLGVHFTFSHIWEFVKWAEKSFRGEKFSLKGILRAQFTFSGIAEFVSRRYAGFSAGTDFGVDLEVHFTFSGIAEFVKWAKKIPAEAGTNYFLRLILSSTVNLVPSPSLEATEIFPS